MLWYWWFGLYAIIGVFIATIAFFRGITRPSSSLYIKPEDREGYFLTIVLLWPFCAILMIIISVLGDDEVTPQQRELENAKADLAKAKEEEEKIRKTLSVYNEIAITREEIRKTNERITSMLEK
jgi:choline-glycine betaine transporter